MCGSKFMIRLQQSGNSISIQPSIIIQPKKKVIGASTGSLQSEPHSACPIERSIAMNKICFGISLFDSRCGSVGAAIVDKIDVDGRFRAGLGQQIFQACKRLVFAIVAGEEGGDLHVLARTARVGTKCPSFMLG
jgi:hypothetical protein